MMMYIYPRIDKMFNKYGLFSEFKPSNYVDNCLITSLRHCMIDESMLTNIKIMTKGKLFIKTNQLTKISQIIDKRIRLHVYYTNKMDHKIEYFGNSNLEETVQLTLIIQDDNWNHYMVYSQDDISEILRIIRSEEAIPITAD